MDKVDVGEIFTIIDYEENEQEVEVLGVINIEGTECVAVGFVEDINNEEEDEMDLFFMKIDEDGELAAIESDEEFDKVSSAFEEILDGLENIE